MTLMSPRLRPATAVTTVCHAHTDAACTYGSRTHKCEPGHDDIQGAQHDLLGHLAEHLLGDLRGCAPGVWVVGWVGGWEGEGLHALIFQKVGFSRTIPSKPHGWVGRVLTRGGARAGRCTLSAGRPQAALSAKLNERVRRLALSQCALAQPRPYPHQWRRR